ncbi:sulfatase-like hydrolase/transferase [Muricauda sp. HICW]|uniref:Sulfatase-like hydrolase/transferase n=1 Tax=Flagellimonas chongwuensis TaxID=2697365 RepID=A0A850NBV1_9FLAO|nr:sulfatase [Allomuricauda chongwuensis]NVN18671.1 sulfatase-like hydrolase/transferase [Allomuricauda chongwuensis]
MRIGLTLLGLLFVVSCKQKDKPEEEVAQDPPNIIFIMSDDHAYQAISAYNHELGKLAPTPNIDRIAKNGAIFQNNFCTNSICGPSRAVILTGKHSHINGFRMNGERFDNSQPTLPKHLKKLGYETAIVGKWHLHGKPTGFDYWDILNDQGNYYNPEFIQGEDTTVVEGYATDLITDKSLEWLQQRKDDKKPFYLMVHHKAPHRNWMPALRHLNVYDSITFPLPDTYFPEFENQRAAAEQQQTIYKDMYEGHDLKMSDGPGSTNLAHNPWTTDFERMTPEQRKIWDEAYLPKNNAFYEADLHGKELAEWKGQRYLHEYLATVKSVDEGIGRILDYLEETGLDENTLVVYTSDQGFYLGEHGWFDKRFMYEESMKMPLLMQLPGVIEPGTNIEALVQNLDFAPTFLDLAGGQEYAVNMQGESFRELLDGTQDDFKDAVYYHYYDFPAFHMVKRQYGVRTDRYKLIHFYDDIDDWEFYDLEKDPKELHNAINDEEYKEVIVAMHDKLDSLQAYYKVTDKEFETTPKEKVDKTYEAFKKLRGTPIE